VFIANLATIVGGIFFGVAHLITKLQGITLTDALWILFAGLLVSFLFVALYRRSQSLWLPIGFHVAWNFCLKGVLGITMSGTETKVGILHVELGGNPYLTGGNFGIESSVISLIVYALVAVLVISFPWNRYIPLLSNK
jgi:membrane protease YdiL (CAAX protease family)